MATLFKELSMKMAVKSKSWKAEGVRETEVTAIPEISE